MSAIAAKASQGVHFEDAFLRSNYEAATAAGLPFMAYHFGEGGDGRAQAGHFLAVVDSVIGLNNCTLMLDREPDRTRGVLSGDETTNFIRHVQESTDRPLAVYEAKWVTDQAGTSAGAAALPLIWPNYVDATEEPPGGDAHELLKRVTPNWFEPFAGHTSYAARQYSSKAGIGGLSPCDVNVCFDDALFAQLFSTQGEVDMTPDQAMQLQQLHDLFLEQVDKVGAGVPWALNETLDRVKAMQAEIEAIKAKLEMA